ncbi:hypothetical protein PENTCL1PPCAC_8236, partial [Pristionchus entomophagus]
TTRSSYCDGNLIRRKLYSPQETLIRKCSTREDSNGIAASVPLTMTLGALASSSIATIREERNGVVKRMSNSFISRKMLPLNSRLVHLLISFLHFLQISESREVLRRRTGSFKTVNSLSSSTSTSSAQSASNHRRLSTCLSCLLR